MSRAVDAKAVAELVDRIQAMRDMLVTGGTRALEQVFTVEKGLAAVEGAAELLMTRAALIDALAALATIVLERKASAEQEISEELTRINLKDGLS